MEADRRDRQDRAGDRLVVGDALLDKVADDDEEDQVEGLQGAELTPSHEAGEEVDEDEDDRGADDDVHGGLGKVELGPGDLEIGFEPS